MLIRAAEVKVAFPDLSGVLGTILAASVLLPGSSSGGKGIRVVVRSSMVQR